MTHRTAGGAPSRASVMVSLFAACWLMLNCCANAADENTPGERPTDLTKAGRDRAPIIRLPVADAPPVIDGDVSDPCWGFAHHSDELWNTDKNCAPDQASEIWLCVDAVHLYVAAYCHDAEPSRVERQQKKRNGNIWQDDFIEITVDATYTQGRMYIFSVTPRGTMTESIPGGSDAKIEWRGDWRAAGRVVADGWICEVAIPWDILRYPTGQSEIGLCVFRHIPRTDEWTGWPNMGAGWDSKEMARIVGLTLPRVRRPILLMPNLQAEWAEGHFRNNVGLDMKHTFDNGLTAVATWAPDFRDIEDEVESIDFSYTERYYQDRRPFFTTGSGFLPGGGMFYSRRIEDLDFGLKAFGRINDTDVGLLQTLTFGERNDTALRLTHKVDDEWSAGVQYVRRDVDAEPLNDVWQASCSRYEPKGSGGSWIGGSYLRSHTSGAESGYQWSADVERWRGEHWSYWLGYDAVSPDFDSKDGYQPEVDRRGPNVGFGFYDKPDDSWIKYYGGNVWWNRQEHFDGSLFHTGHGISTYLRRKDHEDSVNLGTSWTERPPNKDHTLSARYSWGLDELHKGGYVSYSWGDVASADYMNYGAGLSWEFKDDFYGDLSYERRRSDYWDPATDDEDIDRLTLRLNYDLDEERGAGLSLRTGTLGTNLFITYRQAVREGVDWFVVLGDPNADDTQNRVAVKTKWVWK